MTFGKESLLSLINGWKKHPYDLFLTIVRNIEQEEISPEETVRTILSYPYPIGDSKTDPTEITEAELDLLSYRYRNYLFELVSAITRENPDENTFYNQLYLHVFASDFLPADSSHLAYYLFVLADQVSLLPYYEAKNMLNLTDDQYRSIVQSIYPQIRKAIYVNTRLFDTKTNRASQFFEIAASLETREEQIVFWSVVLNMNNKT